ncbi:MAG: protein kinase domain-containing protein [Isosphaeraceae bacterium]
MPRSECLTPPELAAYHLGDLPDAELVEIGDHLEGCAHCQHEVQALDGLSDKQVDDYRASALSGPLPGDAAPPARVGDYEILGEIGRGGMGVVYRARHAQLHRVVALKMLLGDYFADRDQRLRFRAEAEAVARLQHPNIVQLFEIGEHRSETGSPCPYLCLEFVDGGNLAQRLAGPLAAPAQAAAWLQTLAGAAHAAHQQGIIHRDLKPANVLLSRDGVPKICDFGVAKLTTGSDLKTVSGMLVGTAEYMAPEQGEGKTAATPATDVYALGAILYEMLTGKPPFRGVSELDTLNLVRHLEPVPPRRLLPRLPIDLETICLKCLEKESTRRYQSALALADDLDRFLKGGSIQARRLSAAERYWRWARRNKAIAVLGGVLTGVLVLASVASLLAAGRFHTQAVEREVQRQAAVLARLEEAAARRKADEANTNLRATEETLRRTVYATRSNLALAAWDAADVQRLRSLLDLMRPAPGEPDLRGWEWRYLWQLAREDRLTLEANEVRFTDVAFSPDGQTLAGLEGNGRIHFWDRHTGQSLRTTGVTSLDQTFDLSPESGVHALAFGPDGRFLAGPGADASLVLYAVDTGLPICRFEGDKRAILGLAWSPDGRTLVGALSAHVMRVWDTRDGRLIRKAFGEHRGPVAAVAFSPDGRTIASAGYDHSVKLWSPEDPRHPRAVIEGHTDELRAVGFSPDGQRIVSAGLDRTLRVWDTGSGAALAVIRGHTSSVTSLAWLPGGAQVATGSDDETVRVWDTATGQELRCFKGHSDTVAAVAFSPDGQTIATASYDHTVRLWDAAAGSPRGVLEGHIDQVDALAFSPDGRLASAALDRTIRLWDPTSGQTLLILKGHAAPIWCIKFSPDGRTLASASSDRTVKLWEAAPAAVLAKAGEKSDSATRDDHLAGTPAGAHVDPP